ncbi:hypothetical protein [Streptomyces roseus]|uniref:hypothetical protein n=1 Tax=Streptomyces roseus TaxID=66430 RepID=UPI003F4D3F67
MIKNLMLRSLPALALAVMPLLTAAPAAHSAPAPTHVASAAGPAGMRAPLALFDAIDRLPVAAEHCQGYKRDLYKHWNKGLNSGDGCGTRKEVIQTEALTAPQVAAGCKLTGGSWRSAYDDVVVTDAARLDVDHFVPLAEVFDSEQAPWSAVRRDAYANDQASPDTLIAVSAASNRSKADKDPGGMAALGRLLPLRLRRDRGRNEAALGLGRRRERMPGPPRPRRRLHDHHRRLRTRTLYSGRPRSGVPVATCLPGGIAPDLLGHRDSGPKPTTHSGSGMEPSPRAAALLVRHNISTRLNSCGV